MRIDGARIDIMDAAREREFDSVNVDLIYGLPRQTPQTFSIKIVT